MKWKQLSLLRMRRSVDQDSTEKIILQGRAPRDFSARSDAC